MYDVMGRWLEAMEKQSSQSSRCWRRRSQWWRKTRSWSLNRSNWSLMISRSVMNLDIRALLRTESEGFRRQTLTILPPSRTVRPRSKGNTHRHEYIRLDYSNHGVFRAWGKPNLCQMWITKVEVSDSSLYEVSVFARALKVQKVGTSDVALLSKITSKFTEFLNAWRIW